MVTPPFLKAGDRIGIVATARRIDRDAIEAATRILASWNLVPVLSPYLFSENHSYMAGNDEERLSGIQNMLDDPSIKAIICARGGYGTTRIIDRLSFQKFLHFPKWIVGFSDITALHIRLGKLNVESIHGIMPILFDRPESKDSVDSIKDVVFGTRNKIQASAHLQNRPGKGSGALIGGNLSLLVDALGTKDDFNCDGKILVIEEIDEYLYKVDRMMVHLKRSGKLAQLSGMVVGHFTFIKDSDLPFGESFTDIIEYHCQDYDFPIGFNFPTGHECPNLAWIQGAEATLNVTPSGSEILYTNVS